VGNGSTPLEGFVGISSVDVVGRSCGPWSTGWPFRSTLEDTICAPIAPPMCKHDGFQRTSADLGSGSHQQMCRR
jgi:hypothetical protein